MPKRALIVGIDEYDNAPHLEGCVNDARAIEELLDKNEDGSPNFDCRTLTSGDGEPVTRARLRRNWTELFDGFAGDILFYFSGHGTPLRTGGFLVTQDGEEHDPGLWMNELIELANTSRALSVTVILDCCFAGWIGNRVGQGGATENSAELSEGVTILAASRPTEPAMELGGHGVFTELVLGALSGGAADVRGRVSAASIYAYAEAALGPWDQRPLYKSYAQRLDPLRTCRPRVPDYLLRQLPELFPSSEAPFQMDPSYEESSASADPNHVLVFKELKKLQIAGLIDTDSPEHSDLYWAAMGSSRVILTPLGQFYWRLAKRGLI